MFLYHPFYAPMIIGMEQAVNICMFFISPVLRPYDHSYGTSSEYMYVFISPVLRPYDHSYGTSSEYMYVFKLICAMYFQIDICMTLKCGPVFCSPMLAVD